MKIYTASWATCCLLLAAACGWPSIATAQQPGRVPSGLYAGPAPAAAKAKKDPNPRVSPPDRDSLSIQLPVISDLKLGSIATGPSPLAVGLGQQLPAPYDKPFSGDQLAWTPLDNGGQGATVQVTSPGAKALRIELVISSLPANAELHFYAPGSSLGSASAVLGNELPAGQAYWSPTVSGDTIAMEIDLPAGVDPASVRLALPRISHLRADPQQHDFLKLLSQIGQAGSCEVDAACSTAGVSQSTIDSVAEYIFTAATGGTFLCTGTLLNTTAGTGQSLYFLTARHCISQASEASTMEFYWLFQRPYCGAPAPTQVTRTTGGATLLSAGSATDYALVRLNNSPPAGVGLAGWDAGTASLGDDVITIQHPQGDLKKISQGAIAAFATLSGGNVILNGSDNTHLAVHWNTGATEPGSSGSGLWKKESDGWYLIGQLTGGASSCANPNGLDYFGRFDLTFPLIKTFLTKRATTPVPDTIGVYRPSTGGWYLDKTGDGAWSGCAADICAGSFGRSGDIPIAGDWNGGGHDEIGTFNPATGYFALDVNGDGRPDAGDAYFRFGLPGDIPVVGDWNGSGSDKVGVFRPSDGSFSLDVDGSQSWSDGDAYFYFGQPGDIPVAGDWNGDGHDEVGVFRPSDGSFSLDVNGDQRWDSGDAYFFFGLPGDTPVVGDWNGDGRDEVGVFRPGATAWFLDKDGSRSWSGCSVDTCYDFGLPSDKPVAGHW